MVDRSKTSTGEKVVSGLFFAAIVGKIAYDAYKGFTKPSEQGEITSVAREDDECDRNGATTEEVKEEKKEEVEEEEETGPELESFTCPITMQTIRNPATTCYGHLYEMSAIKEWVKTKGTCPLTQKPLKMNQIYQQYTLKNSIHEMRQMAKENEEMS